MKHLSCGDRSLTKCPNQPWGGTPAHKAMILALEIIGTASEASEYISQHARCSLYGGNRLRKIPSTYPQ